MTYITPDVRALIGVMGPKVEAWGPLGPDDLRRFVHAVMEDDPVHFDHGSARDRGFQTIVATPLFPGHAFRRGPGAPDPLARLKQDPDWDGLETREGTGGLPGIDIGLKRLLNGGTEADFFKLAELGDAISQQSRYIDIAEKVGRSGPMVVVRIETLFTNQRDEPLVRVRKTLIMR